MKRRMPTIKFTIKPPLGRDYVHMREITHGSGCGFHASKQDKLRREARRKQQRGWRE